jgi:hypothetical protein
MERKNLNVKASMTAMLDRFLGALDLHGFWIVVAILLGVIAAMKWQEAAHWRRDWIAAQGTIIQLREDEAATAGQLRNMISAWKQHCGYINDPGTSPSPPVERRPK